MREVTKKRLIIIIIVLAITIPLTIIIKDPITGFGHDDKGDYYYMTNILPITYNYPIWIEYTKNFGYLNIHVYGPLSNLLNTKGYGESYYNYFSTVIFDLNNTNGVVYRQGTFKPFNENDITGSLDIPPFTTAKIYIS